MKIWRPTPRGEWPRANLRRIHEFFEASFKRRGEDAPRLVAIASADYAYDDHLYETFIELAPGVAISATWDLSEEQKEEAHLNLWNVAGGYETSVAAAAVDIARHYLSLGTEFLADRLHDLRVQVRSQLADLSPTGGGPRLISLRLTGGDWLHQEEFKVILRLACLDRFLFPDVDELLIEEIHEVGADLEAWARGAAEDYALRHALASQGATGTIDLLTLNAISAFGDLRATLRALGRGMMPWASNGMELFGDRGNLWSYGTHHASGLSWRQRSISHPTVLLATALMAFAGRPVTDLITHPILSADMMIVEAARDEVTGALQVEIEQPRWLFCHQSGRAWESRSSSELPDRRSQSDGSQQET